MTRKADAVVSGLAKVLGSSTAEKNKSTDKKPVQKRRTTSPEKQRVRKARLVGKSSGTNKKIPGAAPEGKTKVTYYIDTSIKKRIDYAAIDLDLKPSHVAEIALLQFLAKHDKKRKK